MKEHELRIRIPAKLFKRYKHLCIEMDLSLPRQTMQIIENFLDIQERNAALTKDNGIDAKEKK